jgi:hypothetical protein
MKRVQYLDTCTQSALRKGRKRNTRKIPDSVSKMTRSLTAFERIAHATNTKVAKARKTTKKRSREADWFRNNPLIDIPISNTENMTA